MKKFNYIFLFCLIVLCCNKKNETQRPKKILNNRLELVGKSDTVNRNKLLKLGDKYAYENKFYEINRIINNESEFRNDTIGLIYAKSNLGLYFYDKFCIDSAYYYFSKAEKLSLRFKKNPILPEILQHKADLLWCQKDYSGAEATAIRALKKAKGKNILKYSCYLTIANSLSGMNNYEKALNYYNKALIKLEDLKKQQQNSDLKNQTHNYIARIYQKQNLHQKTIAYLEDNVNFGKLKKSDLRTYSSLIKTIAYSKFKLNNPKALPLFKEVLQISESTKYAPKQVEANTHLGEYYLAKNDTLTANSYFYVAQKLAHKNQIFEDELNILRFLALANPKKNTYYSNRFIQLNDSLQSVERATRDKFARIEFETDEVTSNNKVVQAENNKLSRRMLFIVSFSLLLLLVIFLWIRMNAQKNKTRELLLKQEQQKANEVIYQLMLDQQKKLKKEKISKN